MANNLYPVQVDWIPGLPQIPYRHGVGKWEGVVMHYTQNPNDTAASERAWESRTFENAFVHEFIDPDIIIQVANPQYIAYGAGPTANQRFIHLELCHADTLDRFEQSFAMWCQRAAVFLFLRSLDVSEAQSDGTGTLWGHFQVTKYLGGTTHEDPIQYLQQWGKQWLDVVQTVTNQYQMLERGSIMLSKDDANKIIDTFLSPVWNFCQSQADKDEIHRLANELRKASGQETT